MSNTTRATEFSKWLIEVYGDDLPKLKPIERTALWVCWKDAWNAAAKHVEGVLK